MQLINVNEYEILAKELLDPSVYDYIASGSSDEITLKNNIEGFLKLYIKPRVLRGVDQVSTDITLLNHSLKYPLFIAPMAFQQVAHPLGELATVQAAHDMGIGMSVSTMSSTQLEDIAKKPSYPLWFQLYIQKDCSATLDLIHRAESAGYHALMITVDMPIMGRRERDIRNKFILPSQILAKNFCNLEKHDRILESPLKTATDFAFKNDISWQDIEWIQSKTTLPLVIKGIMHEDDAKIALNFNIAAIIVSNHGGRQLDGVPATIDVLPTIAEVIKGVIPILVDGGFRRGSDIFKALALGGDCIMIGRPILWALAVNGVEGLKTLLQIYCNELRETMILCGCSSIADIKSQGSNLVQFYK